MNNFPKVSIIVPVFNVVDFLSASIGSAITQSYPNVEVVIVNDGSTDESETVIQKIISNVPIAKLYNQTNQGLSAARNYGLSKSTGDFILFLDSDDQIQKNTVSLLMKKINNDKTEVVFFNYNFYNIDSESIIQGPKINKNLGNICDSKLVLQSLLRGEIEHHSWGFIAKKSIYLNNNIQFPVGRSYEDIATTYKIIISQLSNSISILHSPKLYLYSIRSNSIVNTVNLNHIKDILVDAQEIINTFQNESIFRIDLQVFSVNIMKWTTILSSKLGNRKDRKLAMQCILSFKQSNELKNPELQLEKISFADLTYKFFGVRGIYIIYRLRGMLL